MKQDKSKHKAPKEERRAIEARSCSENMRQLTIGFRALLEDALRGENLTLPQLRLLKAVKQQADVSAAALARTCMVTPQTLQQVLARAVQAQWIVRGKSQKNERFVTATLTPLGESMLQLGMAMAASIEARIWADVGLSDLKRLNELLQAGIANLGPPPA
jgi:MarR family transcriptional regulator, organic hydroperoxide resistance regulator